MKQEWLARWLAAAQAVATDKGSEEVNFDPHEAVGPSWSQLQAMTEHRKAGGLVATAQINDAARRKRPKVNAAGRSKRGSRGGLVTPEAAGAPRGDEAITGAL